MLAAMYARYVQAPLLFIAVLVVFGLAQWSSVCTSLLPSPDMTLRKNTARDIQQVAICVMVTASSKHGSTDLPGTLDGAATLRRSVLHAYNLTEANVLQVQRTVGLEPYNRNNTNSTKWMKPETKTVSAYEFELDSKTIVQLRFIAMVNDDVKQEWRNVLEVHGFEVWKSRTPMEHTEVRIEKIGEDMKKNGATGVDELIKLDGLRMKDFHSVLLVDCDVLFHKRFDELILMEENLGWTHGGWEEEKINGGFLVFSPQHPASMHHMDEVVEVLKEGNFSSKGWRQSGIGWTYGGMTIQGILPYYYFIEANKEQEALSQRLEMKFAPAHKELDRCRYNNMVQLDKCKNIPFDSVISNHFTGDCGKPWHCGDKMHPLCNRFRVEFMKRYKEIVLDLAETRTDVNSSSVVQFVQDVKEDEWCVNNKFVSVSAFLAKAVQ